MRRRGYSLSRNLPLVPADCVQERCPEVGANNVWLNGCRTNLYFFYQSNNGTHSTVHTAVTLFTARVLEEGEYCFLVYRECFHPGLYSYLRTIEAHTLLKSILKLMAKLRKRPPVQGPLFMEDPS